MVYFISENSEVMDIILSDFMNLKEVEVIKDTFTCKNRLLKFLAKVHFSEKTNQVINLPFKFVWEKAYTINNIESCYNDIILIMDSVLPKYPVKYLKKLQQNNRIVLLLFNPLSDIKKRK